MYFWISIVWMFRPSVFFHYVPRFFLKYKKMFLLEFVSLFLQCKQTHHTFHHSRFTLICAGGTCCSRVGSAGDKMHTLLHDLNKVTQKWTIRCSCEVSLLSLLLHKVKLKYIKEKNESFSLVHFFDAVG